MNTILHLISLLFALVIVSNVFEGANAGGHGGGSPLVIITNNHKRANKYGGDILLFPTECGQGLIKDGGRKQKSIFALPGNCHKKKIEKKVEYMPVHVPVPVPVKEYVPVPVIKEKIKKVYIPIVKEKKHHHHDHAEESYAMGYGMGMDTKKSVSHLPAPADQKSAENKPKVKKVKKPQRDQRIEERKDQKKSDGSSDTQKNQ